MTGGRPREDLEAVVVPPAAEDLGAFEDLDAVVVPPAAEELVVAVVAEEVPAGAELVGAVVEEVPAGAEELEGAVVAEEAHRHGGNSADVEDPEDAGPFVELAGAVDAVSPSSGVPRLALFRGELERGPFAFRVGAFFAGIFEKVFLARR